MNKKLFFVTLIATALFAADDQSKKDKEALIRGFLDRNPEFRYEQRIARRVNLFEGIQTTRLAEQQSNHLFSKINEKDSQR